MLKRLKLTRYKGFLQFTIQLGDSVLLMGPNNAGKSTIINAIRLCGAAARVACRLKPPNAFQDNERWIRGYPLSLVSDAGYEFGNVRHEFQDLETRLDLEWTSGSHLHMIWPVEAEPFFWIEQNGSQVVLPGIARKVLTRAGLVPTLTPVERTEKKLSSVHLTSNVETKLSSRHFRNNLQALKDTDPGEFSALIAFLLANTPELTTIHIDETHRDGATWLDVFYRDPASHMLKEIFWAGDGLQIWLQILFHLWRTRGEETVILDEPDVFLHPDLQRRLVRVIESSKQQSILSSHAAEIAAEVSLKSLVWVDRTRKRSRRISDDALLEQFSSELGSAFNLSIARALRARTALFVEGNDLKILRVLARRVGAHRFAAEEGIAVVAIGGYSHWPSVEAFGWIKSQFLGSQVRVRLLLDSDYRTADEAAQLIENMRKSGVAAHVWSRKELESYLLEIPVLARVSGLSVDESRLLLDEILTDLRPNVQNQYVAAQLIQKKTGEHLATALNNATSSFDAMWNLKGDAVRLCPAKDVISRWNSRVAQFGGSIVTTSKLAAAINPSELDQEMKAFLFEVESDLT